MIGSIARSVIAVVLALIVALTRLDSPPQRTQTDSSEQTDRRIGGPEPFKQFLHHPGILLQGNHLGMGEREWSEDEAGIVSPHDRASLQDGKRRRLRGCDFYRQRKRAVFRRKTEPGWSLASSRQHARMAT